MRLVEGALPNPRLQRTALRAAAAPPSRWTVANDSPVSRNSAALTGWCDRRVPRRGARHAIRSIPRGQASDAMHLRVSLRRRIRCTGLLRAGSTTRRRGLTAARRPPSRGWLARRLRRLCDASRRSPSRDWACCFSTLSRCVSFLTTTTPREWTWMCAKACIE